MKVPVSEFVELPEGVSASFIDDVLLVKGAEGEVKRKFLFPGVNVSVEGNKVVVSCSLATKREKKIVFSWLAHIRNMIFGSQKKFQYQLKVCSGHFPMNVSVSNGSLVVKNFLGEKSPRVLNLKPGVSVKVNGDVIIVESCDKELAGCVASDIELLTVKRGRDLRIFQDGIYIVKKPGRLVEK